MSDFKVPMVAGAFEPAEFTIAAEPVPFILPARTRFEGTTVEMIRWRPEPVDATHNLFAPATATVRTIALGAGSIVPGLTMPTFLFELSVLPFRLAATLRRMALGAPSFYLAYQTRSTAFDDDLVAAATPMIASTLATENEMLIGVVFPDRIPLPPRLWITELLRAMTPDGVDTDVTSWRALRDALSPERSLRIVDHAGRPFVTSPAAYVGTLDASGTRHRPLVRDGRVDLAPDTVAVEIAGAGPDARYAYAFYADDRETGALGRATPSAAARVTDGIAIPTDLTQGILQVTDLADWFAVRAPGPASPPWPSWRRLERFHAGSRIEPLIDGEATFTSMIDDMLATDRAGDGFHVAAYSIDDFPMVPPRADIAAPTITELTLRAIDNGAGGRFLVSKILNLTPEQWRRLADFARTTVAIGGTAGGGAAVILSGTAGLEGEWDPWVTQAIVGVHAIAIVAGIIVAATRSDEEIRSIAEDLAELSLAGNDALNALPGGPVAFWSNHPARLSDNPLGVASDGSVSLPLDVHQWIDHFGTWHQKVQVVRRRSDAGTLHVAYVGGIDIHANRRDSPGHQGQPYTHPGQAPNWVEHPFHDVHARVLGPAAADIFQTVDERYEFELATNPEPSSVPPKAFAPPAPGDLAAEVPDGAHVVQVARTYHRTRAPNPPLPFAPSGETAIHDGLINAVRQARDYIYIEDQYFTPSGDTAGDRTLVGALLEAAGNPETALVLLAPNYNDQPFGKTRRDYLYGLLRTAWGDRFILGTPMRRPWLPPSGPHAHRGRCRLAADITGSDTRIWLTPVIRVATDGVPFWLWVDGELMLCRAVLTPTPDRVEVEVVRGNSLEGAAWQVRPRAHAAEAPVTLSQLKGVFVHSKMMIVDDTFVSIGSANYNRRGFFHDGELNVFGIPEQLRRADENPARALRVALWAEHLGLPPAMGDVLLRDVRSALPLFTRSHFVGNRFTDVHVFDTNGGLVAPVTNGPGHEGLMLGLNAGRSVINLSLGVATGALLSQLWAEVIDPTTDDDPSRRLGPGE